MEIVDIDLATVSTYCAEFRCEVNIETTYSGGFFSGSL